MGRKREREKEIKKNLSAKKSVIFQLIVSLLQYMPRDFPWSFADLTLFLNVINGAILLHCEDTAMIRLCMASLVNICIHFDHIFISDG